MHTDVPPPASPGRPGSRPALPAPAAAPAASRRSFLGTTLAAATACGLPAGGGFAAGDERLRVGLVGCGGRGAGAALQAAAADPAVRVVALGDLFADEVDSTAALLGSRIGPQFDCPPARRFVGERAFLDVIGGDVDLVLLTTPPHVRPLHLETAIAAGRHVYCEKPVAVDAGGVVRAARAAARGRAAGLSLVSGFCFRHDEAARDLVARVRDGAIGRPLGVHSHAAIGLPWRRQAAAGDAPGAWRHRNWISFTGLSGGHFVEHHVEAIDRALWLLGDVAPLFVEPDAAAPTVVGVAAGAIGDCVAATSVRYRFADGVTIAASIERRERGHERRIETLTGSDGTCDLIRGAVGEAVVTPPPGGPGRHQAAMTALVRGALAGRVVHEGDTMCLSTMVAVMGRAAADTGRRVTWAEVAGTAAPSA